MSSAISLINVQNPSRRRELVEGGRGDESYLRGNPYQRSCGENEHWAERPRSAPLCVGDAGGLREYYRMSRGLESIGHAPRDCSDELVAWVRSLDDCVVESGLSDSELADAEKEFGLSFPELWKRVLRKVHPVSVSKPPRDEDGILRWVQYPDWRLRNTEATHELVDRPSEGILFDVEHAGFWWRAWGGKPQRMDQRLEAARRQLAEVPRLTPIRGHWYVAEASDSPVLSIVQTDLWSPAVTLCDLSIERDETDVPTEEYPLGSIPFWSQLHAWSQIGHASVFGELAETATQIN